MHSHIISTITLAFFIAFAAPAGAGEDERAGDEAAFNAAFRSYQAAIKAEATGATARAAGEVLELGKFIYPDDSVEMAALYIRLGSAHQKARNHEEAAAALTEGLDRFEALYGPKDERLITPLRLLAQSAMFGHSDVDKRKAQKTLRRVLKLVAALHGKEGELFADVSMEMGQLLYFDYSRSKSSRRYFREAYDIYSQQNESANLKAAHAVFWLGKAADQRGSPRQAEKKYLESLSIMEGADISGQDIQLLAHTYLIKLYEDRGKSDEATLHCQAISRLRPLAGVDGYKPLYKMPPTYPRRAQMAGRSGFVLVDFTVTTSGTVANASVVESEGGKDFQRAALKAVGGFRYAPAVADGVLIETPNVRNLITFEIFYD